MNTKLETKLKDWSDVRIAQVKSKPVSFETQLPNPIYLMNTINQSKQTFGKSFIGCEIDGSSFSADYINDATIQFAEDHGFAFEPLPKETNEDYSQILNEVANDAVSFLNDQDNLPFCSWYFEDNSLFYSPSIEMTKEDVGFISSRNNEYPEDNFTGEWLHVNDHGNCTLYVRDAGQDTEIWSMV